MFLLLDHQPNGMPSSKTAHIVSALQSDILRLQGFRPSISSPSDVVLGPLRDAFPNGAFPLGAVHEFLAAGTEEAAAATGFLCGLLAPLQQNNGTLLWISTARKIYPPALLNFGVQPDRVVFLDLKKEKDVLWAMDEALKCSVLTAVVGEVRDLTFTASRRLQLAVEQSQVTGFVLRHNANKPNTTACVSRWKITSILSAPIDDLPGIGFPAWRVELLRIRNGKPATWNLQWTDGQFQFVRPLQHPASSIRGFLQYPASRIQHQESSIFQKQAG